MMTGRVDEASSMPRRRGAALVLALTLSGMTAATAPASGEDLPPLWGYGVRSCDSYAQAWAGTQQGLEADIAEYRRFEDWLGGFVSGLNLATGKDVLAGADIEGAMRRIHEYCDEHRKDDFFTATMDLVRVLSPLR